MTASGKAADETESREVSTKNVTRTSEAAIRTMPLMTRTYVDVETVCARTRFFCREEARRKRDGKRS